MWAPATPPGIPFTRIRLDGVVRSGQGDEHAIGDATPVGAVRLEPLCQPGGLIQVSRPFLGRCVVRRTSR